MNVTRNVASKSIFLITGPAVLILIMLCEACMRTHEFLCKTLVVHLWNWI